MTQPHPLRADAIRNRTKILASAREQIAMHGPDTGMDEIAAAAGVAVGTLYRHFPNKRELVAAVIVEFFIRVADDAEAASRRVAEGAAAWDEIAGFLRQAVEAAANNQAAKAAARSLGASHGDPGAEQRVAAAVDRLIQAGQAAGDVHSDITVGDIYLLVNAAPTDRDAEARTRWLTLVLPGLTAYGRR